MLYWIFSNNKDTITTSVVVFLFIANLSTSNTTYT